jgi:large subunit ribosomal protein L15
MRLNTLYNASGATKKSKRVGRGIGSGKGKTCGRGVKGQKARTGVSINGFEGGQMALIFRLPKRGFNNIFRETSHTVNFDILERFIAAKKLDPKDVNAESLAKSGLIKKVNKPIKILAKGKLTSIINIEVNSISASAKELIEKLGGTVKLV